MDQLLAYILHIDVYLAQFVHLYGTFAYVVLFVIVFLEMGCILTPFLPGDSLLFAAGTLAATSELNVLVLMSSLFLAAFIGRLINYSIGQFFGHKFVGKTRFFTVKHLEKTHDYFERYGNKTIVISCFIPMVRTFAPFVAGMARMEKAKFVLICLIGSLLWTVGILYVSYRFGNIPFVKENFSVIVIAIIVLSLAMPVLEFIRKKSH